MPVAQNAIEKNKKVSKIEPFTEDAKGGINQFLCLSLSNTKTSILCETIKAVPDPIAILIEIKSEKFVEKNKVNEIPRKNPK